MRLLIFHCRAFSYTLDHPTPVAEDGIQGSRESFANCVVVFACAEQHDNASTADAASAEVARIAKELSVERVILNPFAHLSNAIAKPRAAIAILKKMTDQLRAAGVPVHYSPFGWYKAFEFNVLGHGGSQLFRSF